MAGFLRVPPKSLFKKLLLGTGLWRYTYVKMSTNLKSTDMLKDAKCKKRQLAQRPPIPYVPVVDLITPKEDPAILKVKLPCDSHISIPIFSHGNNEEYIAHIVAVLRIIKQKGLHKKCRMYAKAVVKRQAVLKNLQEASEPQVTSVDVAARVKRRGGTSRLGVSLETHVKIWYQKLKLKLSYKYLKTHKTDQVNPCAHMVANLVSKQDPKIARNLRKSLGKLRFS